MCKGEPRTEFASTGLTSAASSSRLPHFGPTVNRTKGADCASEEPILCPLSGVPPPAPPRFPHTRAQLTSIARQYRPLDNYDDELDDGTNRITSAFVARVASLLEDEREDDQLDPMDDLECCDDDDEDMPELVDIAATPGDDGQANDIVHYTAPLSQ